MNIRSLNQTVGQDFAKRVEAAEANYAAQLQETAQLIQKQAAERPVILLSGPSGSGKTTTAKRLEELLDRAGFETHVLSMDHYFKPLTPQELQLAAEHRFDLESPDRVDYDLLAEQLSSIIAGTPTPIPRFDFATNQSRPSGEVLTRGPKDLLLLEGIHALNPDLTGASNHRSTRIYVSVRTRVQLPNGKLLHPSRIRLMRRLARDQRFRGCSFETTLQKLDSVELGEERYIMPYKHRAQMELDSFLEYEPAVFRDQLLPGLLALPQYPVAQELAELLQLVEAMPEEPIPANSLLREFLGGSCFHY